MTDAIDSAVSGLSLADTAYHAVLEMLLEAKFVGGNPVQERRLAEQLKISRTPVREALSRLQSEGLLTGDGSRTLRVAQIGIAEFVEILNARKLLEVEAAGLAAEKGVRGVAVEEVRRAISDLLELEDPTPGQHWTVDDLVHGLVSEGARSKLLAGLILDLRRRTHVFNTRRLPHRRAPGAAEHLAIIDALVARDAPRARAAMALHIDNVKAAIINELLHPEHGTGL